MYNQIDSNKRQTIFLFLFFFSLLILVGWGVSYYYDSPIILYVAIGLAVFQSWFSYFFADQIALAVNGAKAAPREQFIELHRLVENLAITAGLPKPNVYVIDDQAPNAFATGRNPQHSAIAVTTGLLAVMDKQELEGVLAHEMSHIRNYDILVMTICVTLVGAIVLVADIMMRSWWWGTADSRENRQSGGAIALIGIILAVIAPLMARLIQLAVSRKREYLADASGVELTRYPDGLAAALAKIESYERPMIRQNRATAHLYINEPFGIDDRKQSWLMSVFSTHPPIHERIKKLQDMA